MRQKSNRYNKSANAADELLGKLYAQARMQFGDAIKSYWFYDGDLCPACNRRPIGTIKFKGEDALSMNAFIYRQRGVLIGYLLCETCAAQIFRDAQKNPYTQTPVHAEIERTLIAGYHAFLGKLDA
jgi:hypothetical protein